jgi:VanZ family protein
MAVLIWLVLIVLESTPTMSSENTGHILATVLNFLFGPAAAAHVAIVNTVLRKTGHFSGYGVLSLLVFRALRTTFERLLVWRAAAAAVVFTALVASLDEWHQTFLPSRTGAFRDVVLDTVGALCMQALVIAVVRYRAPRLE